MFLYFLILVNLALSEGYEVKDFQSVDKAHAEVDKVKIRFKETLNKALKAGGIKEAIPNCKVSADSQYKIGRTSLRLRNQKNTPPEWTKPYLEKFSKLDVHKIPKQTIVKIDDNKVGYLEPIFIEPICLSCHGDIGKDVKKVIHKDYPSDKAIGYKLGDFRGLIWLEMQNDQTRLQTK